MAIERDFFSVVARHRRLIDQFMDSFEADLSNLLSNTNKKARRFYVNILKSLEVGNNQRIKATPVSNFAKMERVRKGVDNLSAELRSSILRMASSGRKDLLQLIFEKEKALETILGNVGVENKRSKITKAEADILDRLFKASLNRINITLEKWRSFSYNTFFNGISAGIKPIDLETELFTEDGNIRIGSSLESEIDYETTRGLMEQRTQYQLGRAERLGYGMCWNFNPMDQKTKPICMSASLAGVIPKEEMRADYGFPPRFRCRCDITFVDASWNDFNNGINSAIENRRTEAIALLEDMPKQKTEWRRRSHSRETATGKVVRVKRHDVETKDPGRLEGKRYADVEERLDILEEGRVPSYKWDPPEGWKPPRDFRTLAQLVDPNVIALGEEGVALLTDDELRDFVAGDLTRDMVDDIISRRL